MLANDLSQAPSSSKLLRFWEKGMMNIWTIDIFEKDYNILFLSKF